MNQIHNNDSSGPFAAFSTDVEDYFQVEAFRDLCPRDRWRTFEDRTEQNTERILELLERHKARGTFFILGWTARRHPGLVRRIAEAGHEVASHGYDHELVTRQTPRDFREDVRKARALLQDLSGQEILGYRAPSYTVVKHTKWALRIVAEEGYRYDSSVFPIKRMRYGIPNAPRWPHRISFPDRPDLVEFPLPTIRLGFFNIPATGGAYLRLLPFGLQRWALGRFIRAGSPFVLTVHPWELDPDQPRLPVRGRSRWTHYHNLDQTSDRIDTLLSMAKFLPQIEILQNLGLLDGGDTVLSL
jgi:polysaccharide deacetylase family protein (PEP-CTERM system associated)